MMPTLSIISQPAGFVSANNPIEYKVQASPAADVDSVLILVAKGGVAFVSWLQQVDFGSADTYTFRIEQIVQDILGYNLHGTDSHGYQASPNSIVDISVGFIGAKAQVYNTILANSNTVYCLNTCFQAHQAIDFAPYVLNDTPYKRFLTNGPLDKEVSLGESEVLSVLTDNAFQYNLYIQGFDNQGNMEELQQPLSNFNTEKRIDVAIGPSNLTSWLGSYMDDKVRYNVAIAYLTGNLFYGSGGGNFDSGLSDIQNGPGVGLALSTNQAKSGTHSLKMTLASDPNLRPAWFNDHTYQLHPNTNYWFQAYVYVEDIDILSWGLYLELTGFTDAVMETNTTNPLGRLFIKAFHDANRTDYFDQWLPLYIGFKTGNDTQGSLRMNYVGDVSSANVYVDEVTLKGNISAAKASYKMVPHCLSATRVHFLNRLGAMDSYTFTGAERRNIKTESTTYQKLKPTTYNPAARGTQVLQKDATVRLSCSSNPLRPDEMLWLEELLTSPAVYVQRGNINIPVIVKDGEFEVVDPVKNIHRMRLELEYANDMVLQQG